MLSIDFTVQKDFIQFETSQCLQRHERLCYTRETLFDFTDTKNISSKSLKKFHRIVIIVQIMKSRFINFLDEVNFCGTKEIYRSNFFFIKICWVMIILTGTLATTFYLHNAINEYRQNPIATKVNKKKNIHKICSFTI